MPLQPKFLRELAEAEDEAGQALGRNGKRFLSDQCYWRAEAFRDAALATEAAAAAETAKTGSVHESAVAKPNAQTPPAKESNND